MLIVVSRHTENIDWTSQFPNVLIYNKGPELKGDYKVIPFQNVGREGHTYYRYIYDHYDNLEDYTVFLQGNPFDHSPNIISDLHKHINAKDLDFDFKYLSEGIINFNLTGDSWHPGLPLIDCYEKIFGVRKESLDLQFSRGAQFIVSRRQILKRPREFYLKIVQMLEYHYHPIEGFVMERFHKAVFSDNDA